MAIPTPKVEKPKVPIAANRGSSQERANFRPRGRESLISAGKLQRKATTLKSSLLG